jgi:hypothetical protein
MHNRDHQDEQINSLVLGASTRQTDEYQLASDVLHRVHRGRQSRTAHRRQIAPVGFAMLLIALPILIAEYPGTQEDALILAFTLGEPLLSDMVPRPFLYGGGLE